MSELGRQPSIYPQLLSDIRYVVRGNDFFLLFYAGGNLSERGRSPARLAEVLGCGLPAVANEGVCDVANIVRKHNVGVLLEGPSAQHMETAFEALQTLMHDPDLSKRCRATAEAVFSLEAGTQAHREIYASILKMKDT